MYWNRFHSCVPNPTEYTHTMYIQDSLFFQSWQTLWRAHIHAQTFKSHSKKKQTYTSANRGGQVESNQTSQHLMERGFFLLLLRMIGNKINRINSRQDDERTTLRWCRQGVDGCGRITLDFFVFFLCLSIFWIDFFLSFSLSLSVSIVEWVPETSRPFNTPGQWLQ